MAHSALVLGGNSDIGLATVRALAAQGLERVVLATRDAEALRTRLAQAPLPVTDVAVEQWDANDVGAHAALLDRAGDALGAIDVVICAVGSLGHGAGITATPDAVSSLIAANFGGPAAALTAAAHRLTAQGHGAIVVLSSVAGLRARRSNYVYGSAKAGLDTFTSGLADAVAASGVRVHLVRPGFVTSKMTTGLRPAPFATTPEAVAAAICAALGKDRSTIVHVPRVLGPLFVGLRATPRILWRAIAGDR
jgi:decaprenylphospho-beta-D-erythro-pentofuranosid-2-ulose 2-reductase